MKDLIILGAGPGGYELAIEAAKKGLSTVLIEASEVGGTCLHHGCIPTKSFYKTAEVLKEIRQFADYGIEGSFTFQFAKTLQRKNEIVKGLTQGIKFLLNKANVELVYGKGKLVSQHQVAVGSEIYEGENIVIATGSSAAMLPLPGFTLDGVITSKEILDIKEVPKRLAVIGGGVVGIELATIFAMFGSEVEVIEAMDTILPNVDTEVSKRLQTYLKGYGVKIHTKAKVTSIEPGLKVNYTEKETNVFLHSDKVLVAVGRKPNLSDIGLDEVGILYDKKGIIVDSDFRTNLLSVYAIGDVTGKMMLAHSATYSGYQVLKHILKEESFIDFTVLPSCVFTFPEIASLGKTEEDCSSIDYRTDKFYFKANGKALTIHETDGFVKIISFDDQVFGIHIIGPHASDLIHEFVPVMNKKIPLSEVRDYIHAHPTLSEAISSAIR